VGRQVERDLKSRYTGRLTDSFEEPEAYDNGANLRLMLSIVKEFLNHPGREALDEPFSENTLAGGPMSRVTTSECTHCIPAEISSDVPTIDEPVWAQLWRLCSRSSKGAVMHPHCGRTNTTDYRSTTNLFAAESSPAVSR